MVSSDPGPEPQHRRRGPSARLDAVASAKRCAAPTHSHRRAGASLRVLTAVKAGLAMYGQTEARTAERRGEEVEGELRVRAESALRQATDALNGDVSVETDAFVEDPADVLIRVSEHLDLLIRLVSGWPTAPITSGAQPCMPAAPSESHALDARHFAWEQASDEYGRLIVDWVTGGFQRLDGAVTS